MATSKIAKMPIISDLVVTETRTLTFNTSGYVRIALKEGYSLIKAYVINGNDMPTSITAGQWQITEQAYKGISRDVNLVWLKTDLS